MWLYSRSLSWTRNRQYLLVGRVLNAAAASQGRFLQSSLRRSSIYGACFLLLDDAASTKLTCIVEAFEMLCPARSLIPAPAVFFLFDFLFDAMHASRRANAHRWHRWAGRVRWYTERQSEDKKNKKKKKMRKKQVTAYDSSVKEKNYADGRLSY